VHDRVRNLLLEHNADDDKGDSRSDGPASGAGRQSQECHSDAHAKQEIRQANQRVKLDHAKPEQLIVQGIGVGDPVRPQQDVGRGERETGQPGGAHPQAEPAPTQAFQATDDEGEDHVKERLGREAPGDRIPVEKDARKPGLQQERKSYQNQPGEVHLPQLRQEKQDSGQRNQQREQIRRINTGEAGLPEAHLLQLATAVDVDQDEAGQDKEEADAEVSELDCGHIRPNTAPPEASLPYVKKHDPDSREESQRGQRRDVWTTVDRDGS
jgi:hypothetical protein